MINTVAPTEISIGNDKATPARFGNKVVRKTVILDCGEIHEISGCVNPEYYLFSKHDYRPVIDHKIFKSATYLRIRKWIAGLLISSILLEIIFIPVSALYELSLIIIIGALLLIQLSTVDRKLILYSIKSLEFIFVWIQYLVFSILIWLYCNKPSDTVTFVLRFIRLAIVESILWGAAFIFTDSAPLAGRQTKLLVQISVFVFCLYARLMIDFGLWKFETTELLCIYYYGCTTADKVCLNLITNVALFALKNLVQVIIYPGDYVLLKARIGQRVEVTFR